MREVLLVLLFVVTADLFVYWRILRRLKLSARRQTVLFARLSGLRNEFDRGEQRLSEVESVAARTATQADYDWLENEDTVAKVAKFAITSAVVASSHGEALRELQAVVGRHRQELDSLQGDGRTRAVN